MGQLRRSTYSATATIIRNQTDKGKGCIHEVVNEDVSDQGLLEIQKETRVYSVRWGGLGWVTHVKEM